MKKLTIITVATIALCGCGNSDSDCTNETAGKFLLCVSGRPQDMNNLNAVNYMADTAESVKSTGYESKYYGTPICKVVLKETNGALCYVYNPQTSGYELFDCPKDKK
ncbi:MAG: hypothetical protein JW985_03015 [Alphaproteobacteria bacterium]|nr:hypothetical protein [Alphaproteobacteria bacterium]